MSSVFDDMDNLSKAKAIIEDRDTDINDEPLDRFKKIEVKYINGCVLPKGDKRNSLEEIPKSNIGNLLFNKEQSFTANQDYFKKKSTAIGLVPGKFLLHSMFNLKTRIIQLNLNNKF